MRVSGAWAEVGVEDEAHLYMRIENTGTTPAMLAQIEAEGAGMATLVASPARSAGGVPETLDGILLPPGVATMLEPGGLYLLLSDLATLPEAGEALDVTLEFETLGPLGLSVPVLAAGAEPPG